MRTEDGLQRIVDQLGNMVQAAASSPAIGDADLRQVLGFITKVVQVVEQAFQDVLVALVNVKYFDAADLDTGRLRELQKQLDLLLARSRYRDAEEICSRLHYLGEQYDRQIRPLLGEVGDADSWRNVFALLNEHEGYIIYLISGVVYDLGQLLSHANASSLAEVRSTAAQRIDVLRRQLDELHRVSNTIMGLSGQAGLLELTGADRAAVTQRSSVFVNTGGITVSGDTITSDRGVVVGRGAQVGDISLQQTWQQVQGSFDLKTLADELARLRQAMRATATSAEHDQAVGAVAAAEQAALKQDGPAMMEWLKKAGKWALDSATTIGVSVAQAALKAALGF